MDRSQTFRPERGRPVPVDWPAAQLVVLHFVSETGWRERCQSQARGAANATDGHRGNLSETAYNLSQPEAQDLPVFAATRFHTAT